MASFRSNNAQNSAPTGGTVEVAIKDWLTNKLNESEDMGMKSLLSFLERKSNRKILSHRMVGRSVLLVTVHDHDKDRFTHLNGFTWAGTTLTVEDAKPPRQKTQNHANQGLQARVTQPSQPSQSISQNRNGFAHPPTGPRGRGGHHLQTQGGPQGHPNDTTAEVENTIISVIRKRYNAGDKHLILNTLVSDPELLATGLINVDAGKVYKAIFTICQTKVWETTSKRRESVMSVSLRSNGLKTVQDIISLASTFPHLRNLDLADNDLEDLGALKFWKNQFRDLEHLILSGNPVAAKPDTVATLARWYPNLNMYNGQPIDRNNLSNVSHQQQQLAQPPLTHGHPANVNQPNANIVPPAPQSTPVQGTEPTRLHPEFPPGSTFGLAQPNKAADVLLKEQMGLQFSFETRLKMQWVENCLSANNWDYATAMANFANLKAQGQIPADAYIEGV